MKKKILIVLLPIPVWLKDGGSGEYKGIFYTVTDVHSWATIEEMENRKEFNEGIIIEISGIEIYSNVK